MNSDNKTEKSKQVKPEVSFVNLKSDFFLLKLFGIMKKHKSLDIVKYNKKLQNLLEFSINDYKENSQLYSSIQIELKLDENKIKENSKFINIQDKEKDYYHIYFDGSNEEIKRNYLKENEKIKTINIKIDYQVKSLKELFKDCICISSIIFKQFNRNDIIEMNNMFDGCLSVVKIDLSKFNTENVNNMDKMFYKCHSLKELNLSNFNTENVTNMDAMFAGCILVKELNLSNFNTKKVTDMSVMFAKCHELKELNISNLDTSNVRNMSYMFA